MGSESVDRSFTDSEVGGLLDVVRSLRSGLSFQERWEAIAKPIKALIPIDALAVFCFPTTIWQASPSKSASEKTAPLANAAVSHSYCESFSALAEYFTRHLGQDRYSRVLLQQAGQASRLSQIIAEAERARDGFAGAFLESCGLRHMLAAIPEVNAGSRLCIALFRKPEKADFSLREVGLLDMLVPHLREASRGALLNERLTSLKMESDGSPSRHALLLLREDDEFDFSKAASFLGFFPENQAPGDFLAEGRRRLVASEKESGEKRELRSRIRLRDGRWIEVSFARVPETELTAVSFYARLEESHQRFRAAADVAKLSPRERQVAALAARGLANKEIARELDLGKDTIKEYLSKAYAKTGADGRAALTAFLYGQQ